MVVSLGYVLLLRFPYMMHCCWNRIKASKRYLAITEGNIRRGIYFCKQAEIFLNDAVMQWFPLIEFAAQEAHWLVVQALHVVKKHVLWRFGDLSALCSFLSVFGSRIIAELSWLTPHYWPLCSRAIDDFCNSMRWAHGDAGTASEHV